MPILLFPFATLTTTRGCVGVRDVITHTRNDITTPEVVRNVQLHGHSGYGYVPSFLLFTNTYAQWYVVLLSLMRRDNNDY